LKNIPIGKLGRHIITSKAALFTGSKTLTSKREVLDTRKR